MRATFLSSLSRPMLLASAMLAKQGPVHPVAPTDSEQAELDTRGQAPSDGDQRVRPKDSASISGEGLAALAREQATAITRAAALSSTEEPGAKEKKKATEGTANLTASEQEQVRKLQARDVEVKAHEAAHASAAGSLATGGPSYEYERGPDGVQYAVGGEVSISVGSGSTPEQKAVNAARAQRAATAPANPSGADRSVAAKAAQALSAAKAEIAEQQTEKSESRREGPADAPSGKPAERNSAEINREANRAPVDPRQARRAQAYQESSSRVQHGSQRLGELYG